MNENLNLVEILKDCPKGTKLYSTIYGEVEFDGIRNGSEYYAKYVKSDGSLGSVTAQGLVLACYDGECTLFPSREQRDWSKFKVKKPKFDPKPLCPFEKVLARNTYTGLWRCTFYSHKIVQVKGLSILSKYATSDSAYIYCIPYNEDTKHLVGTTEEAPVFYRYWED